MQQILQGTGSIIVYFVIAAGGALGSRCFIKIPNELFRKILHGLLLGSLFMFTFAYEKWWISALAAIYIWGFGDAAAALVGKKYGKHKIKWKYTDGKKSIEGSLAMFITSVISVVIVLSYRGRLNVPAIVVISLGTAAVSTLAELCSKNGNDTVICPMSAMVVLLPLVYLFGGLS